LCPTDQPQATWRAGRGTVPRSRLFDRLAPARRVTIISGPAGSGKTQLVRSWIAECGLGEDAAWVTADAGDRDPQGFWVAVVEALGRTRAGSKVVGRVTAAPDLDAWGVVDRLLGDLEPLSDGTWLVVDDVHELSSDALRQFQLFLMRAPAALRLVLIGRHDIDLALHRLRLEDELTEIRTRDLRFSVDEARALFNAAGIAVTDAVLHTLHEKTEGWAAGLRLAALSMAHEPDPERFAAEFSGSDRTVAEFLLAEVLERQPEEVRRLLLCTSLLERVNGELADLLTGGTGGEGVLRALEDANAFVVALDGQRSWFRYHPLFAELLQLELRASTPAGIPALHLAASQWFGSHGFPIEGARHAQAGGGWDAAVRLLSENFFVLYLDGRREAASELLAAFPATAARRNPELAALLALNEVNRGSLEAAEQHVALARTRESEVPEDRRIRFQVVLGVAQLSLARRHDDVQNVVARAGQLVDLAGASDAAVIGSDLLAIAMVDLGSAELWAGRHDDAQRHLERGRDLAKSAGRPWLELVAVVHLAERGRLQSLRLGEELGLEAVALAAEYGWGDEPDVGIAYTVLGSALVIQGRLNEAEVWLARAARVLQADTQPAAQLTVQNCRGLLEATRGQREAALAAFQSAERVRQHLVPGHPLATRFSVIEIATLAHIGETARAETVLAEIQPVLARGEAGIALAPLRLAHGDPAGALEALMPVLDGSAPVIGHIWKVQMFLMEATARDALGDAAASSAALERALDAAEGDSVVLPFVLFGTRSLLEQHARRTAHPRLLSDALRLFAGRREDEEAPRAPRALIDPLTDSEVRVLRYLPTNLSAVEIARELYLSVHTVRTHVRHLFDKLGAHKRSEAVQRARELGLLASWSADPSRTTEV